MITLWFERFPKHMNSENIKTFFFLTPFLQVFVLIVFRPFFKFHSSKQDTLTVACNRKHEVNHRWKWFITIAQVSDRK